jgi:hypothetical protein
MDQNGNTGRRYKDTDDANVSPRHQSIDERADEAMRARVDMTRTANDDRYKKMEAAKEAMRKREEESLYANRTLGANYAREDSLEALAKSDKKRARLERKGRERALGEFYEKQQLAERGLATFQSNLGRGVGAVGKVGKVGAKRLARRGTFVWSLTVAGTICFWQFVFGALSLVGFAMHAYFLHIKKDTWWGKILGFFADYENWFPGEQLGMGFWAVSIIIGVGGFIAFAIYFYMIGIKMFNTVTSTLIMAVCFALTVLPVSNIFPWLFVWVFYLSTTSLFSSDSS